MADDAPESPRFQELERQEASVALQLGNYAISRRARHLFEGTVCPMPRRQHLMATIW